jgi:hypothetical protein
VRALRTLDPGSDSVYTTFRQITDDVNDARVHGGIHFRFDQEAGARQGRAVATYIHGHYLGSVNGPK